MSIRVLLKLMAVLFAVVSEGFIYVVLCTYVSG